MSDHADVVIAGAGPNGLLLACELLLAGVRPVVLDTLSSPSTEPRANGVVGQAVRFLDHRGLYEALAGPGQRPEPSPEHIFAAFPLHFATVPDSQLYRLLVPQLKLSQALVQRAGEYGADIRWGHALAGFEPHAGAISVRVASPDGGYELTASYLVGADGGHSLTRKLAGIDFPGTSVPEMVFRVGRGVLPPDGWVDSTTGALDIPGIGRVAPLQFLRTERGMLAWALLDGQPLLGVLEWEDSADAQRAIPDQTAGSQLTELRASIERVLGTEMALRLAPDRPFVFSHIGGFNSRVANHYKSGRVLLIGDAAHVHSALGGPGLNLGLQDAANLGWKLAGVVHGHVGPALLDTFETERRPVGERVIVHSRAQIALIRPGPEVTALRTMFGELLALPDVVRHLGNTMSGAEIRYPTDPGAHPLVGRWVPDLTIQTADAARRVAEFARGGRPLLLDFTDAGVFAATASHFNDRVTIVTGQPVGQAAAAALLVRPDGYVAWASSADTPEITTLNEALHQWFGISSPEGRPAKIPVS